MTEKLRNTRSLHVTNVLFALLERLEEDVGWAFGLDTSAFNSVDDCRQLIRPGPPVPHPGMELSFVRRQVANAAV